MCLSVVLALGIPAQAVIGAMRAVHALAIAAALTIFIAFYTKSSLDFSRFSFTLGVLLAALLVVDGQMTPLVPRIERSDAARGTHDLHNRTAGVIGTLRVPPGSLRVDADQTRACGPRIGKLALSLLLTWTSSAR